MKKSNFSEHEGVSARNLRVDRIEAIDENCLGFELLSDGVRWQSEHVHFNVSTNFLIRQKLTRNDLERNEQSLEELRCRDV